MNNKSSGKGQNWRKGVLKYSETELMAKCNEYFQSCAESGKKLTQPGLILHLGVTEETFRVWLANDKGKYGEVSGVLKRAMLMMRDDLEQRGDTMSLFRLKQPCYGGYADRHVDEGAQGVTVNVTFGSGDGKTAVEYGK